MPEALTPRLDAALGANGVALSLRRGSRVEVLGQAAVEGPAEPAALLAVLEDLLARSREVRAHRVRVVVHDGLARYWRCEPMQGATRIEDVLAGVRHRFQSVYDEAPEGWAIAAPARADRGFLACALRQTLVEDVAGLVRAQRRALVSLVPESVALVEQLRPRLEPDAWLVSPCGEGARLAILEGRELAHVRQLPAGSDADGLADAVRREALLLGLGMPRQVLRAGRDVAMGSLPWWHVGDAADALGLCGVRA